MVARRRRLPRGETPQQREATENQTRLVDLTARQARELAACADETFGEVVAPVGEATDDDANAATPGDRRPPPMRHDVTKPAAF
jgi:hypothetical protein